jgi:hypothetical protein
MQAAQNCEIPKGRSIRLGSKFLATSFIQGTKVIPHVVRGGLVVAFTTDYDNGRVFSGDILTVGADGRVYAAFRDSVEAESFAREFIGCDVCSIGGFENAYDLGAAQ